MQKFRVEREVKKGVAKNACIPASSKLVYSWNLFSIVQMSDKSWEIAFNTICQWIAKIIELQ